MRSRSNVPQQIGSDGQHELSPLYGGFSSPKAANFWTRRAEPGRICGAAFMPAIAKRCARFARAAGSIISASIVRSTIAAICSLFEVNASMLVHEDNAEFPCKDPAVRAIKRAFDRMLASRAPGRPRSRTPRRCRRSCDRPCRLCEEAHVTRRAQHANLDVAETCGREERGSRGANSNT
jgi:hypothetical protein